MKCYGPRDIDPKSEIGFWVDSLSTPCYYADHERNLEGAMSYEPENIINESYKTPHPCDHCGVDDEPVHAVQTGDGFLILCETCRAEAVGGS